MQYHLRGSVVFTQYYITYITWYNHMTQLSSTFTPTSNSDSSINHLIHLIYCNHACLDLHVQHISPNLSGTPGRKPHKATMNGQRAPLDPYCNNNQIKDGEPLLLPKASQTLQAEGENTSRFCREMRTWYYGWCQGNSSWLTDLSQRNNGGC